MTDVSVSVVADAETLARTVAEQLLDRLGSIQADGRVPSIALTGGTIAIEIYRALARLDSSAVDWTQVDFWWGDERYVPADSSDRNDRGAELDLLDVVGADPARVHAMPAADEAHPDVASAAAAYEQELRTHGGGQFDLVLLGLGPDGHVASLFPGSPQLAERERRVTSGPAGLEPFVDRVTMTLPMILSARQLVLLVTGADKADAVRRVFREEVSEDAPGSLLRLGNAPIVAYLDRAAAGA